MLLSVPHGHGSRSLDLLLQLEDAVQQSLRSGGAPRDIDIHRHNPVTAPDY